MKKVILGLGIALSIAGCETSSSPYAEASRQLVVASSTSKQMTAECLANRAQFRNMVAMQYCLNAADNVLASAMIGPTGVSMRWRAAQLLILADKVDKKQVNLTQYSIASAEINAEALAMAQRSSRGRY